VFKVILWRIGLVPLSSILRRISYVFCKAIFPSPTQEMGESIGSELGEENLPKTVLIYDFLFFLPSPLNLNGMD